MPQRSKSVKRRIGKLRNEFYARPWAMMPHSLGFLGQAIESGDTDSVKASLSFGGDGIDPIMSVVNGVAVIPVTGVLRDSCDYMVRWGGASSYQLIERDFLAAINNEQIKSIVFYVDSPGGSAVGVKRLADLVYSHRGEKPIWSYVQGMCGSAAYYLACASQRIESTADAMVGSVGTIFPHMEMSGFLKEIGYGVTVITNSDSPKKGHGNPYEPLSPDSKETLQKMVESYGRPFIEDVAKYRGITPDEVVAKFGQGDAMRADSAIKNGMVDAIVSGFSETLQSLSGEPAPASASRSDSSSTPVVTGSFFPKEMDMKVSKKIRAQLFALDLIDSPDASDQICEAALKAWFRGAVPGAESDVLAGLRASSDTNNEDDEEDEMEEESSENESSDSTPRHNPQNGATRNVQAAHDREQSEARMGDLRAAAKLINKVAGSDVISADMVLDACEAGLTVQQANLAWGKKLEDSSSVPGGGRVNHTGQGSDRFANDAIDALLYSATGNTDMQLSADASRLVGRPLWAIAAETLQLSGQTADIYGDREVIAEEAMTMGNATRNQYFFSDKENRQYVQASAGPANRPGDFPNILSGLANKFLDMIELDDDYSYSEISAVLPGGLRDFKPALMINKGIVEELDEVEDDEAFKELNLSEEVLSYLFIRRFGNKWGWTPTMIANDDMGAFVEGMLGLREAWEVTQNRTVLDLVASNATLLDGNALYSDRADTGSGSVPAANNNDRTSGGVPSDSEWGEMSALYAGIGGVGTGRRVRGVLNTVLVPTNKVHQEAVRTFETYPVIGETKQAATTANVGIYRNKVRVVAESELNSYHATRYYGFRNPTRLNTATIVRGYFTGFGVGGRRERWYDPTNKTTYISLEGRMGAAIKNWRYTVRNKGAA